jgi:hypothetical protein
MDATNGDQNQGVIRDPMPGMSPRACRYPQPRPQAAIRSAWPQFEGICRQRPDHIDLAIDKIAGQSRKSLDATLSPSIFDPQVLAFDKTRTAQPLSERGLTWSARAR